MEPFQDFTSPMVALERDHIDTDQMMPKEFLKRVERTGYGKYLFYDWRYLPDGKENPEFPLNQEIAKEAKILVTGENFGCGSSREHAVWGLVEFGFRCIIAPSFADIFANNALQNGLLLVELPKKIVERLFYWVRQKPKALYEVSLEKEKIAPLEEEIKKDVGVLPIEIEESAKIQLLKGLDEVGITLQFEEEIAAFEKKRPRFLENLLSEYRNF